MRKQKGKNRFSLDTEALQNKSRSHMRPAAEKTVDKQKIYGLGGLGFVGLKTFGLGGFGFVGLRTFGRGGFGFVGLKTFGLGGFGFVGLRTLLSPAAELVGTANDTAKLVAVTAMTVITMARKRFAVRDIQKISFQDMQLNVRKNQEPVW